MGGAYGSGAWDGCLAWALAWERRTEKFPGRDASAIAVDRRDVRRIDGSSGFSLESAREGRREESELEQGI